MPMAPMTVPPRTSILSLISFLHHHLRALLDDPATLLAARQRCIALLEPPPRHCCPRSSDQNDDDSDVLGAMHGAIDAFHPASGAFDGACCLAGVEEALQAPALLPEHGETAGLNNRRVAACAYFYLALVRCALGDAWQSAMHFLQAVAMESEAGAGLAPRALWEGLFDEGVLARAAGGGAGEEDAARRAARRYKDWLMYYKVMAAVPDAAAGAGSDG